MQQVLPTPAARLAWQPLIQRFILPFLILIAALVLRTANLRKIGMLYDESITRAVVSNIWHGDLRNNWKYANVPPQHRIDCYNFSSYMYADALFVGRPKHNSLHLDRWFSALTGTAAIFFFYLVALRLFGWPVALVSLAAMAVIPILVQDAHYARPEAFVTLLCAAVYLLSVQLLTSRPRLRFLAASSFCCGLLIACKFSLAPMALIPVLFLSVEKRADVRTVGLWIGFTVAGTFAGVPDAFFHPQAFWNGVQMLRHQYAGAHIPHALMNGSSSFPLLAMYFWQTLGPVFCALCLAGIVALAKRREYFQTAIIAGPVVFYVAVFSSQRTFFERNLSHVVPLIAILSAIGLVALANTARNRARTAVLAVMLVFMLIRPARVSAKLVFVAMSSSYEERTSQYEKMLLRTQGLPVEETSELLAKYQVQHLAEAAIASEHDILVRILDYQDPYTQSHLVELERCTGARQVGYVPSLFPYFSVNTIITYHAPAFRYVRLSPPAQLRIDGFTFVPWMRAAKPLAALAVRPGSWVENGVYPDVAMPNTKDRFFGSYTSASKDANQGTIQVGPIDVNGIRRIAIPIVTGPANTGLSVSILDHASGLPLTQMTPPPVLPKWTLWQIEINRSNTRQIDIVAKDDGTGWGQWLAIGLPLSLKDTGG